MNQEDTNSAPVARTEGFLDSYDWSRSDLGPRQEWPAELTGAVQLMLDSLIPMWLAWGPSLSMVYNPLYVPILGGKHPHAMGAPLAQVWADVWPDVSELVATAMRGQALYQRDLLLITNRDGQDEQAWFTFSYSPLRNRGGEICGLLCAVWETTQEVIARSRLAESELALQDSNRKLVSRMEAALAERRLFATIVDSTHAMVQAVNREGRWSAINSAARRGLAPLYSTPPTIGASVFDALQGPIADEVARAWRAALAGHEFTIQLEWGEPPRTHEMTFSTLQDSSGKPLGIYQFALDVTERNAERHKLEAAEAELFKSTKAALLESERQYRALFEAIDEGFCIIEFLDGPHGPLSDYVHVAANPAYADNAGIPNVVGQRVRDMVPDEADGWVEIYRNVLLTGVPVRFERELVHTGRYLELASFRLEPPERRQVAVLFQDVTKRHRAEIALRELTETLERRVAEEVAERTRTQEALRQAQKMEAVGQLTGGIAHDFNNMLAVVVGSLDLLARRFVDGDPGARRYVDSAREGAKRAAQLTQRLLAFSRQQPLKPEPLDANKVVAGMSDLLRRSLGGDVRLETVLAGGLWRTHADPNQLESVILNLAVNGRDAMPEGGRLTIETANAHLDQRYTADAPGLAAGQYVLIAVSDTGTGMTADVLAKAFDPFFTTKEVGRGTGLGLSQVYGFVKQSGGHVKIYSEPGDGTTVKVYLPRLTGPSQDEDPALAEVQSPRGDGRELVLVVEDEPAVRQFSVAALGELGYRVLEADGAAAALKLLDAHPDIALLFTDVVMPEVNGRRLAEEALRRRPGLRVLFTTGYTRNAVVHNGVLDPGVQLLGKPFTVDELATRVREVLDAPASASGLGR
ncbi:PAS domain-containing protein [Variovorax dokdonensis]|uniref:histidine kinase n=1 Tax=Variovorax dokdonensis TaxID=344883 RepID=A0ABT7N8J6_9BURK|nr:PAS domain-containing protein [Variovorax dokdonensis]MDM0044264.1 PAS domain-containing protein [Variovorax dokdonensis]